MKIIFDATESSEGSGISTYSQNLMRFLPDKVKMHFFSRSRKNRKREKFIRGLFLHTKIPFNPKEITLMFLFHPTDKNTIFHGPGNKIPLITPFFRGKFVLTLHDVFQIEEKKERLMFFKKMCDKADKIITVSNYSKENISEIVGIDKSKIKTIYDGVEPEFFNARRKEDPISTIVSIISNTSKRKNIEGIKKSWEIIKNKHNNARFIICGNIDQNLFPNDSRTVFLGKVDRNQLVQILSIAHCLLFPSFAEGFGLPVIEAMAVGCPVVASDIPVIREIVGDDSLIYVNPYSPEDIANGVLEVLKSEKLRKELSERGKNISQNFRWEKTAEETLKTYRELVD